MIEIQDYRDNERLARSLIASWRLAELTKSIISRDRVSLFGSKAPMKSDSSSIRCKKIGLSAS